MMNKADNTKNFISSYPDVEVITKDINNAINTIGIPPNINGYYYLRDAILIRMHLNVSSKINIGYIYKEVANIHNTSIYTVERSIRYAIDVLRKRDRIEHFNRFLGWEAFKTFDKPTNSEFIIFVAKNLKG